jgi:hypothetical protein
MNRQVEAVRPTSGKKVIEFSCGNTIICLIRNMATNNSCLMGVPEQGDNPA